MHLTVLERHDTPTCIGKGFTRWMHDGQGTEVSMGPSRAPNLADTPILSISAGLCFSATTDEHLHAFGYLLGHPIIVGKTSPTISFTPSDDNVTVFTNYTDRIVHGHLARLPLITGSNTNEGAGFVPFTPSGPGNATLVSTTLSIIACPVARDVARRGLFPSLYPTYRYLYTGNFTNISPVSWFGAYHSAELPLLFGTHDEYGPGNSTSFEYTVSKTMEALWLSFAENPAAGPKRFNSSDGGYFAWPQFQQSSDSLVISAEGSKALQLSDTGPRVDNFCGSNDGT